MPYCRKCGTELKENAQFCHVCGAPVAQASPPKQLGKRNRIHPIFPISLLIGILVTAVVVASIVFLPIRTINQTKSESVSFQTGINTLKLNFTADIAQVNVTFESLPNRLVILNMSAVGAVGILAPPDPVRVSFNHTFTGGTLTVNSRVYRANGWTGSPGLKVACQLRIDPSMNLALDIKTAIGEITLHAKAGVAFDLLKLETTTGAIEADLAQGELNGDITIRTTTGGINLAWENVKAARNIQLDVRTTTGGLDLNAKQNAILPANVTLNAQATTGGIVFALSIGNGAAARIESSTTIGGITTDETHFSGTKSSLQSDNYPSSSNIIAGLKTTTGGIYINATYNP
jgi:hypothetical protein